MKKEIVLIFNKAKAKTKQTEMVKKLEPSQEEQNLGEIK